MRLPPLAVIPSPPPVRSSRGAMLHIDRLRWATHDGAPWLHLEGWSMAAGVHLISSASEYGTTTLLGALAGAWPEAANAMAVRLNGDAVDVSAGHWRGQVFDWGTVAQAEHWAPVTGQQCLAQLLGSDWLADCGAAAAANPPTTAPPEARALDALLDAFNLQPHVHKPISMLSTGTRRKLFLVAALLTNRPVVLLGEPFAALDARSIQALWYALAVRNRIPGQVVLLATTLPLDALPQGRWAGTWSLPELAD